MKVLSCVLLFAAISASVGQQVCPPPDTLAPCTCTEGTKPKIRCENIRGRWDIKATFDNFSSLVDSDVIFDKLEIFDTSLFEIPSDAVSSLKFYTLDIMMNQNLEYIAPDAFGATRNVTTDLSLWNNYLKNAEPYERDLFDFFNQFPNVESIWFPTNAITSVPSDAFVNLVHLKDIYFGSNSISRLGSRIFTNLPSLTKVYFSHNDLSNEEIAEDTFAGVPSVLDISVESNTKLNYLDEAKFKPLLDVVNRTVVGASYCGPNGCSYNLLNCDERADWICLNVDEYQNKLFGFRCGGGIYSNIWEYCGNTTLHAK